MEKVISASEEADRIAGWRAAQQGQHLDEHRSIQWLMGYRDYWQNRLGQAQERNSWTVH